MSVPRASFASMNVAENNQGAKTVTLTLPLIRHAQANPPMSKVVTQDLRTRLMNKNPFLMLPILLVCGLSQATEIRPFTAACVEGETHRYDGGNGKDMSGAQIDNPSYGWSTEKWGKTNIVWSGGKMIVIDKLNADVLHAERGVISAFWFGSNGLAVNLYSFVLDTVLGQALYSQSQASALGENRSVKVRSQNLSCAITWLN